MLHAHLVAAAVSSDDACASKIEEVNQDATVRGVWLLRRFPESPELLAGVYQQRHER